MEFELRQAGHYAMDPQLEEERMEGREERMRGERNVLAGVGYSDWSTAEGEFAWVKAHMLNECPDQLATRLLTGDSHGPETLGRLFLPRLNFFQIE
jgi:hypothetical protein